MGVNYNQVGGTMDPIEYNMMTENFADDEQSPKAPDQIILDTIQTAEPRSHYGATRLRSRGHQANGLRLIASEGIRR